MSTSISLGTSADLDTLSSKGFSTVESNLSKLQDENINIGSLTQRKAAHKIHSIDPTFHMNKYELKRSNHAKLKEGFYDEVDARMSRNSNENPDQQAKYVDNWLSSAKSADNNYSPSHWGRIVGIRGFASSEDFVSDERDRAKYNKIKFEHSKLQSDYDKLKNYLDETVSRFRRVSKKKDSDISALRSSIRERTKCKHNECKCCHCKSNDLDGRITASDELYKLRYQLGELEIKLSAKDEECDRKLQSLRSENEMLKQENHCMKNNYDNELGLLQKQIKNLSVEPANRMLLEARNENSKLRDLTKLDMVEFEALKERYQDLESDFKSMLANNEKMDEEKSKEMSNMLAELCRLQVYQPKLEMILQNEREIKSQLQARIGKLEEEIISLKDNLRDLSRDLNNERMKSKRDESLELDALQAEIKRWQDKCYRMKKEKSDAEDLLRSYKSKMSLYDARHQSEMEVTKEMCQCELAKMELNGTKLEEERDKLKLMISELRAKLNEANKDKQRLDVDVAELNGKLQSALAAKELNEISLKRVDDTEKRFADLMNQFKECETKKRELVDELEGVKQQFERSKQQVEQLKHRFKLQQKRFDELKEDKDREVGKLRVDLNCEQYNRQVALAGLEKELRLSLKELEAMKYRFSKRLLEKSDATTMRFAASRACDSNGSSLSQAMGKLETASAIVSLQ